MWIINSFFKNWSLLFYIWVNRVQTSSNLYEHFKPNYRILFSVTGDTALDYGQSPLFGKIRRASRKTSVKKKLMLVPTPGAQNGAWTSLSFFFLVALTSFFSTCATDFAQKEKKMLSCNSPQPHYFHFILVTMQLSNICLPVQQMWTEWENGGKG